jgi:hypothetical protein
MLKSVYDAQERFSSEYGFRKWCEMGAGHCDWVPGPDGHMQPIPKSIGYDSLDQAEFEPIHRDVFAFLRSEYARHVLWPHLRPDQTYEMIETLLAEFEGHP